jgi:TM2 domain-containing membrane protein YozV
MTQPIVLNLPAMDDQQRAAFYASYQVSAKSEVVGVLLAVFLGGFGAHHFYLRRTGLGILYAVFSVTGIPFLIAFIEAFFMPGRVRQYNAELSAYIAATITGGYATPMYGVPSAFTPLPPPAVYCPACGNANAGGVRFCGRCGASMASAAPTAQGAQ